MTQDIWRFRLHRNVNVFCTTRRGGYSQGEYGEFNINPWVGDDPEAVARNRQLLAEQLRLHDSSRLLLPHQVHGTEIRLIDRGFFALAPQQQSQMLEGVDGLMTDVPSVAIGVSTADCLPIVLYDPVHHAACVVHAGWRGTAARIAQKGVKTLCGAYGSNPEDLRALIGPGITLHKFEVGYDVWSQFQAAGFEMDAISMQKQYFREPTPPLEERKWYIDLPFCNRFQLEDCGLKSRRIMMSCMDSYEDAEKFFSVRRQGPNCGRTYTAIIL